MHPLLPDWLKRIFVAFSLWSMLLLGSRWFEVATSCDPLRNSMYHFFLHDFASLAINYGDPKTGNPDISVVDVQDLKEFQWLCTNSSKPVHPADKPDHSADMISLVDHILSCKPKSVGLDLDLTKCSYDTISQIVDNCDRIGVNIVLGVNTDDMNKSAIQESIGSRAAIVDIRDSFTMPRSVQPNTIDGRDGQLDLPGFSYAMFSGSGRKPPIGFPTDGPLAREHPTAIIQFSDLNVPQFMAIICSGCAIIWSSC